MKEYRTAWKGKTAEYLKDLINFAPDNPHP